ncbi:MAG: hypothetical protein COB71_02380 [Thiotrichales bacterium]|nr:MAG: hypothetical protein COB71_02380 [Thiotrichales bacterium]
MQRFNIISLLVLTMASPYLYAATLPSGDEIANNINARDEGQSVIRTLTMEMTDKRGKQRVRKTRGFRKYFGDEKRTAIYYLSPKNVKDTAFMIYDYADTTIDDDQWLYLPAMRKVRRISAADRGDYFLGTDFTYEDIKLESKISITDYSRKTIGEEMIHGHQTYIVESIPIDKETAKELGYSKVKQWVDAEIWIVRKAEFTNLRNRPLKTIYTREIKQVQGIWSAHLIEAENHKTRHTTKFIFSDIDYQTEVNDDLFTERALRRGL